jgi:hypothetical protein
MLAAAVAVACSDQKAPTGPDEVMAVPEFNFSNAPDVPGSGAVVRWTDDGANPVWAFWVRDWNTDLTAWAATDPNGWCRAENASEVPVDVQVAGFNLVAHGSNLYAAVYDATGWDGSGDYCDWIDGKTPLATGLVDFRVHMGQHDTWKVQGQLETGASERAHFRMMFGRQYDPHPPYSFIGFSNLIVKLIPDSRD